MFKTEKAVFISYRRTNIFIARAVRQHLKQHGFDVFIDVEDIDGGAFGRRLLDEIARRAHFLVILTPSAVERLVNANDWVRKEVEHAIDLKRNIIPLMFDGFDFSIAEPYLTDKLQLLKEYQALRVPDDFFEEAMERLITRFLTPNLADIPHPPMDGYGVVYETELETDNEFPSPTPEQIRAEHYYEKGIQADEDPIEAIDDMTRAIELSPSFWQAYYMRGRNFAYLRQRAKALEDMKNGFEYAPNAVKSLFQAAMQRIQGNFSEALKHSEEAVRNNPEDYLAYYERARAKYRLRDFNGSIEDYGLVLERNPLFIAAFNNRGDNYKRLGNFDKALDDYNQGLLINPYSPILLNSRAELYFMQSDYLSALLDFRKANDLRPAHKLTLAGLAITYHALKRVSHGVQLWQSLISQDMRFRDMTWVETELDWFDLKAILKEAQELLNRIPQISL